MIQRYIQGCSLSGMFLRSSKPLHPSSSDPVWVDLALTCVPAALTHMCHSSWTTASPGGFHGGLDGFFIFVASSMPSRAGTLLGERAAKPLHLTLTSQLAFQPLLQHCLTSSCFLDCVPPSPLADPSWMQRRKTKPTNQEGSGWWWERNHKWVLAFKTLVEA